MDGSPHLPPNIRQWYGDSRGRWEGNALVIDVTNFSPKTDFSGVARQLAPGRALGADRAGFARIRRHDRRSTVWARRWTVTQVFTRQSDQENRIYTEPRCNEGNYALPGILRGARMEELAYAEGRGPHPATRDSATAISGAEEDPLQ